MSAEVLVVVFIAIGASTWFTLRWFINAGRSPIEVKPAPPKSNPHDAATTARLKHFFAGKQCAACSRPIPPVHIGEQRPGLITPDMQDAIAWADIPTTDLAATLESHLPICSHCQIIESFRLHNPELVVDRHRTVENSSH